MTPALDYLAADPQVRAALVLTDGDIDVSRGRAAVRRAVGADAGDAGARFAPPYGRVRANAILMKGRADE